MIYRSRNLQPGSRATRLLLLILAMAWVLPICSSRAGSIFDDDLSPAPAPPRAVQPPNPAAASNSDAPASSQPSAVPAQPITDTAPVAGTEVPAAIARHRPIPPKTDQSRSRKLFKDVYRKELADQSPEGRRTLSTTLIHQASKLADAPADQFVLLLGAYEAAGEAGNLGLSMEAADALADVYDVDGLKLKADIATRLAARASGSRANAEICRDALPLLDELIAAGDYVTATRLASAMRPMASSDAALAAPLLSRGKEAAVLRAGSETFKKDLARLKASPEDAAANLSAGQFLCFAKGDWASGLPFLARGSDVKLKALATAELAKPTGAKPIEQLGDRWFEFDSTEHDLARARVAQHAASLYSDALDSAQGMQRTLLEKKVDQTAARSGSLSRRVNLLGLIDPGRDAILGSWKVENGELVANNLELSSRLRIPYRPPAEYDFRIDFTRVSGNCILQMLSHEHHKFKWLIDYDGGTYGFDMIDGQDANNNPTHLHKPNVVRDGERCSCVLKVRRGSVAAYVNGELFEKYQTDYSTFSLQQIWDVGDDCLGIGLVNANVIFHAIELTEITGAGRQSAQVK